MDKKKYKITDWGIEPIEVFVLIDSDGYVTGVFETKESAVLKAKSILNEEAEGLGEEWDTLFSIHESEIYV